MPGMRTALLSGALLAFALSFDEVIVTLFTAGAGTQTIPLWILAAMQRPTELPVVNVVALVLILLSVDPGLPRPAHRRRRRAVGAGLTRSGDARRLSARGTLAPRPATERRISRGVITAVSASIRPAAGMPAWRIAVIGAVGILAVGIGLAAGSFLLNTRAAAVGAGAAYVPADAPFYVELRLEPSAEQDAALRELLGRFPPIEGVDLDQPLYTQMVERIDEMLAAEGRRRQLGR